jgi:hypothetical protein
MPTLPIIPCNGYNIRKKPPRIALSSSDNRDSRKNRGARDVAARVVMLTSPATRRHHRPGHRPRGDRWDGLVDGAPQQPGSITAAHDPYLEPSHHAVTRKNAPSGGENARCWQRCSATTRVYRAAARWGSSGLPSGTRRRVDCLGGGAAGAARSDPPLRALRRRTPQYRCTRRRTPRSGSCRGRGRYSSWCRWADSCRHNHCQRYRAGRS